MDCCTGPQSERREDKRKQKREQKPEQKPDDVNETELAELLDLDFEHMRRQAQGICQTLLRPKDQICCRTQLEDLSKLNQSNSLEIKKNVNKFFKFYLKALRWTQLNQPVELYEKWYHTDSNSKEQCIWLEPGKSFYAMKEFEDGSIIVYQAMAKDPSAGWTLNGLKAIN